ncbi:MAG TPA: electron transfer flavoprotein subunit alpha/FixB family protein [Anaerolineae bacterium]|jgi:electron transfer flavoprotein alpha subunit|nr:electron transfer flavoprotein subunit alpha/FixB family protein [Anaerolineae bacterium]
MLLAVVDHDLGNLNKVSLEMLSLAQPVADELGEPLEAVLIGQVARPLADHLPAYGVSRVHLVQHAGLEDYAPEAWAASIVELQHTLSPAAIVAPGTERGNEVLAHVAAIMNLPMAANCAAVRTGDTYTVTRLRWGGSLLEEATLVGEPKLFSVAAHTIEASEAAEGGTLDVNTFEPSLEDKVFRVRLVEREEAVSDKISLAEARVVIGGGRGVGSSEGFAPLETLADLLGGAIGGSRVVTNLGWRPHADQIGQTGTRIAPDLYIACGISGAIQHMVGCMGSKHILAINTDREAPIMAKADYAVIGDLHEILPALVEAIGNETDNP